MATLGQTAKRVGGGEGKEPTGKRVNRPILLPPPEPRIMSKHTEPPPEPRIMSKHTEPPPPAYAMGRKGGKESWIGMTKAPYAMGRKGGKESWVGQTKQIESTLKVTKTPSPQKTMEISPSTRMFHQTRRESPTLSLSRSSNVYQTRRKQALPSSQLGDKSLIGGRSLILGMQSQGRRKKKKSRR